MEEQTIPKKKFTILGFSIWRLMAYFIIYSIAGYIIETTFGLITKGVVESRKSFLYGPFCAIYGVGAVIMIVFLQYFKKNNYTLFFGGFLIGSIVEYIVSLIGEILLNVKWWDYSDRAFNLNGRICITFSFFWGILAIYLITHFNPIVDKLIDKIKTKFYIKVLKIANISIILIMLIDCIITGWALKIFFVRLVDDYDLKVQNVDTELLQYVRETESEKYRKFTEKYFSNKKMLKTFPNLKLTLENGDILFVKDLLKDIQPYYFKVFTPRQYTKTNI